MKKQIYRHGDIAFIKIDELPKNLIETENKTILQNGSGNNPHTFTGGKFYQQISGNQLGYFEANKMTKLFHAEHSPKGVKLPVGYYKILRQQEFTESGDVFIED